MILPDSGKQYGRHVRMSEPKRKRESGNSTIADTSILSLKRLKQIFSSSDSDNSISESGSPCSFAPHKELSQPRAPIATSSPIVSLMNAPSEMAETELETKLEKIMDRVLNRRMDQLKNQIKDEVLSEVKASISNQMGNMEGQIFDQNENAALKSRIDKLEKQTDTIQDNKVQNVLNDQYACRSNMVVFGLLEAKKENCAEKVIQVIHQHLKINLQPREIEIAHRLG